MTRIVSTSPAPALIQNRLSRWPRLSTFAEMAAEDRPNSRKISATPTIASTMATRP